MKAHPKDKKNNLPANDEERTAEQCDMYTDDIHKPLSIAANTI